MKTIEKITHNETPKGLPLHIKWTEGRELLRNSPKFEGKAGWEPVSTVGTRVIYDAEWSEYAVYVYINKQRYYPADYFETDKSEALAFASSLRDGKTWGVWTKPSPKVKKIAKKAAKVSPKVTKKAKLSPKVKKVNKKSSPKVKTPDELVKLIQLYLDKYGKEVSPKVTKKAKKSSPKVKPVAKKAAARRARRAKALLK